MSTHTVTRIIRYPIQHKPSVVCVPTKDLCPEHLVNMVETQQGGRRINTYCPICNSRQIAEGLRGDK